jgi:hypothetical protein
MVKWYHLRWFSVSESHPYLSISTSVTKIMRFKFSGEMLLFVPRTLPPKENASLYLTDSSPVY